MSINRNLLLVILVLLLAFVVVAYASSRITRQEMEIARLQEAPSSGALAAVAELREMDTPPPQEGGSGWPLALALLVLVLLALTGVLFFGERFTKQFRLLKRKGRQQPRPYPQQPMGVPPAVPELTARTGRIREVPALPPGGEDGYL